MKRKVILASASPRRLEIMNKHGLEPVVMPTAADETITGDPSMTEVVEDLSHRKALACYSSVKEDNSYAGYMLRSYRGTFHYVVTGITLIDVDSGDEEVLSDITRVWCKDYTDEDIENYISMAEPYDKAGAYAIQGYFGRYIDRIEGDYENVVGLPYYRIEKILENC